jgi:glycosyltransferase involved in cell wall biosynthesis
MGSSLPAGVLIPVPERLKVLLSIPDLQDLGVQHDVRCLMRYWDREHFEPVMLVHKREGAFADQFPAEMASFQVDDHSWDMPRARVLLRILGYARVFDAFKPHAVISFVPYCNLASAAARRVSHHRFGLAVSEHAHVSASLLDRESFGTPFLSFYRRFFPFIYNHEADIVKCIAEESRQDLIRHHGIRAERTRLIHNPVDFDEVRRLSRDAVEHPWFGDDERRRIPILINVGRLANQKKQDLLLRAFASVRRTRPARLVLVGRGPYLERLKSLALELGVDQDVAFLGFQRNPWKYVARSSALVLSSIWEGLPCVVTESMVLGVPVVATRCPSGPTEMLLDDDAGFLCPMNDMPALAAAIQRVFDEPSEAARRAKVATENLYRFEPRSVTRQYEDLVRELAQASPAAT